jgi:hypothetical protein
VIVLAESRCCCASGLLLEPESGPPTAVWAKDRFFLIKKCVSTNFSKLKSCTGRARPNSESPLTRTACVIPLPLLTPRLTAVGPRTTRSSVCGRKMPVQCLSSGAAREGQLLRAAVGNCSTGAAAKKGGASPIAKRRYLLLPPTNKSDRHAGYRFARRTLFWLRSSEDSLARWPPKRRSLRNSLRDRLCSNGEPERPLNEYAPRCKGVLDEAKGSA